MSSKEIVSPVDSAESPSGEMIDSPGEDVGSSLGQAFSGLRWADEAEAESLKQYYSGTVVDELGLTSPRSPGYVPQTPPLPVARELSPQPPLQRPNLGQTKRKTSPLPSNLKELPVEVLEKILNMVFPKNLNWYEGDKNPVKYVSSMLEAIEHKTKMQHHVMKFEKIYDKVCFVKTSLQVRRHYIETLDETFSEDALEIYNRQIPYNAEKLNYDQWMRRKKNNMKFAEVDLHEQDRRLQIVKADLCQETYIHMENMTTARDLDHARILRLMLLKPHRLVFGVEWLKEGARTAHRIYCNEGIYINNEIVDRVRYPVFVKYNRNLPRIGLCEWNKRKEIRLQHAKELWPW